MSKNFQLGIELGKKHYARIARKGKKWRERNIPAFIRQTLMVPYYITELDGNETLFVIQYPVPGEKVHFRLYAHDHPTSCISNYPK